MKSIYISLLILTVFFSSCHLVEPPAPADDELLDGPVSGLTTAQNQQFLAGDVAFNDKVFTATTGLGPLFVATSCGSCHAGDGKGHPFTTLTRFGQVDSTGNLFLDQGGPQLQHLAIPGYQPEQIPVGATSSKFLPPANTGLGYLELVPDADLLAMADPYDQNGDGISGVPNYISLSPYITAADNAIPRGGKYIGRFGRKAAAYNLMNQTVNAYNQDMGITSEYFPNDLITGGAVDYEVNVNDVKAVVFYLQTLKAPIQRKATEPTITGGQFTFMQIGCGNCHRETLTTGPSSVTALSEVDFHPYTDLLLHDMGPLLDDGYTEGTALTSEWRTTPLWGIGLSGASQGGQLFLMHDGRARTFDEAIQWHGGEAEASKNNFNQLTEGEKVSVIAFLNSL